MIWLHPVAGIVDAGKYSDSARDHRSRLQQIPTHPVAGIVDADFGLARIIDPCYIHEDAQTSAPARTYLDRSANLF